MADFWCFWRLFYAESGWNFLLMCLPTLQCHMPKMAPSDVSLDMLQASFMHKSMTQWATYTRQHQWQRKECTLSTCVACHCCWLYRETGVCDLLGHRVTSRGGPISCMGGVKFCRVRTYWSLSPWVRLCVIVGTMARAQVSMPSRSQHVPTLAELR